MGFQRLGLPLPLGAVLSLLGAASGCASAQTERHLERTLERASLPRQQAPEAPSAPEPDLSAPLERDVVVALAVARSPALALLGQRARALVHAGRAEGALPSAELMFQAWNLPLARPYALGDADMYMLELRQRFPAAGARDARARAMAEEADAVLAELAAEERAVAQRAADAHADQVQALAEQRVLAGQLELLGRLSEATRARYSTGGAGLAEAARIDLERARTERALSRAEGDLASARASLNALLRRPLGAELGEPREAPPQTVAAPLDELVAQAHARRGQTLSAEARVRAASARRQAAEAEARAPEVMVGLGYWQDLEMRPGLGVTAAMSLPWLWGPEKHRAEQARAEEASARAARDGEGLEAQAEITAAFARLRAAEGEWRALEGRALPSARRAIDALTAAYSTGSASLLEWVDAARTVLDLELESADLEARLARDVNALERAVGAPLARSPLRLEQTP